MGSEREGEPSSELRLVGREAELAKLTRFALGDGPPLLCVVGPAGVGKTSLLRAFMRDAVERGLRVAFFDAALESFRPAPVLALADGADVVVFDDFHRLALLETWFFDVFLASLTPGVRVVLGSRRPPRGGAGGDRRARAEIDVIEVRALSPSECATYLALRRVPERSRAAVQSFGQGLPLWLSIGADLALARPDQPFAAEHAREHLGPIVERLVEDAGQAGPGYRRALDAAALFVFVTESRLACALDVGLEEASAAYRWLVDRPFVQRAQSGVRVHDALRDALRADLAWRDPEGMRAMLDRIYPFIVESIQQTKGGEQQRIFLELCRMLQKEPGGLFLGGDVDEQHYPDAVADDELELFLETVRRHEGDESATAARLWLGRARDGLVGFRDATRRLVGFVHYITFDAAVLDEVAAWDPFAPVFRDAFAREGPLRDGERATIARWWLPIESSDGAGIVPLRLWAHMTWRLVLASADPVVGAVNADPEHWLSRGDRSHDLFGTFTVAGRPYGIFGQDFRRTSRRRWFARQVSTYRHGPDAPPGVDREYVVLDEEAFGEAVRSALRAFARPSKLADNPLLHTRLVEAPTVEALRRSLRDAIAALGTEPRGARHGELLDHAFLRQEQKGVAIAAELGLPFGSYRRLLGEAVDRLVEELWSRERRAT